MTCYTCKNCPLAFVVGYSVYWDLSGGYSQYVCRECGTMHRIDHRDGQPDVLLAIPRPILATVDVVRQDCAGQDFTSTELPISENSWCRIGEIPTPAQMRHERVIPKRAAEVRLDGLACTFCGTVGRLVSHEAFGDGCPKCGEKLELVYVDS
jgi:hypothetical protein